MVYSKNLLRNLKITFTIHRQYITKSFKNKSKFPMCIATHIRAYWVI